jgi:uncharacterized alkaline shock family protein YloU
VSTAPAAADPAPEPARAGPSLRPTAPDERGHLAIHPSVLRKIVEHAVDQVPGTLHRERTVAGFDVGDAGIKARITTGAGDPAAVDVALELALRYPGPVREVVAAVRDRVGDELVRLTGHRLRNLAVTVTGLRGAPAGPRLQ